MTLDHILFGSNMGLRALIKFFCIGFYTFISMPKTLYTHTRAYNVFGNKLGDRPSHYPKNLKQKKNKRISISVSELCNFL